ncbi:hypothetical protein [Pseudomonas folii]|uniref:hypothetical protein n=1 Tax=Pseudomonas folii TaxID=2762593 RepID=UPI003CCD383E
MDFPKSVPNVGLVSGKFVDENTMTGQIGSLIPAAWGNALTEEILNTIIAAGLVPNEATNTQLLAAIRSLQTGAFLSSLGTGGTGENDYVKVPFRDKSAGVMRFLIINWGSANVGGGTSVAVTFAAAYTIGCRIAFPVDGGSAGRTVAVGGRTNTGATFAFSSSVNTIFWMAVGV